jgi:hypothetical protein
MRRLFTLAALVFCLLPSGQAFADPVLPQALVQYVQDHPNATQEEIRQFMDGKTPETAKQEKLLQLARSPDTANFWRNCLSFLVLGITHILTAPDHICVVLSILLTFVSLRRTVWLLSCFTLSHSITLILAGSNILRVSSLIVEPLIALSIAYVAFTTVFLAPRFPFFAKDRARALTVLAIGFIHGMGFAGVLQEVAVPQGLVPFLGSLLSFNVGIDIGQICIVLITLPLILLARGRTWYPQAIRAAAGIISIVAMVWFVQRIIWPA